VIATEQRPLRVTNTLGIAQQFGRWRFAPGQTLDMPMEFVESYGGAGGLEIDFSRVRGLLRTRDESGRLAFDFHCPLSSIDGYGRHALDILEGLKRLGAAPVLLDAEWQESPSGEHPHLPPSVSVEAKVNRQHPPARIGVAMTTPYDKHLTDHQSVYRIGITQFETDRVPAFHVKQANKLDHLILTSQF
jgi:hypothetical protein